MPYTEDEVRGIVGIYDKMMKTPAVRGKLLELVNEAEPDRIIPELQARKAIDQKISEELKARDEKLEKIEKDLITERLQRKIDETRAKLKSAPYNFSDEDIAEVEKIVVENGVSYEFAADHLKHKRQALRPSGLGGRQQRHDGAQDWRGDLRKKDSEIKKDFDSWQDKAFSEAFREAFSQ